ncbi:MAG: nitrite reductase small subunit NirD [Bryobacterales bacterium]|nr:nitrite reductase small subunit NirD [Bryobacterales bacterium]
MSSSQWVPITAIGNLPLNEGRSLLWQGHDIALFNLGSRVIAVENRCPHQHGPIVDGIVSNVGGRVTVTCPLHTRRICLDSGQIIKPATAGPCVRSFPAKIEDGIVLLRKGLSEAEAA